MLFALGAASAVLDIFKSIGSSGSSAAKVTTGLTQTEGAGLFDTRPSSTPGASTATALTAPPQSGALSPDTLNALLAAQGQQGTPGAATSRDASLKDLFSLIDGDGNGQISKSEFENALGAGGTNVAQADDVFGKMDTNGDGSISADEMASALKGASGHHSHRHAAGAEGGGGGADALAQALDGSSSTTTTNSDGSTTTTVTYADGSKVTLTTPASQTASSSATSSYNFVEQAIQRQAQALSTSAQLSLRA